MKRGILVAVFGYGCHLTENIKRYLDLVIEFVDSGDDIFGVLVTGGETNKLTAPGATEASIMGSYLVSKGLPVQLILDHKAMTTNENIRFVRDIRDDLSQFITDIVIFCDKAHELKVKLIFKLDFGFWPETIAREVISGDIDKVKQWLIATPLCLLAYKFRFFREMELRRKERIIAIS